MKTFSFLFLIIAFFSLSLKAAAIPIDDIPRDPVDPPVVDVPVETMPTPVVDCSFNGATIQNGNFATAYQSSSVAYGNLCVSEQRRCLDGALDGSYQYGACAIGQPASCLFDGQTVAHGESVTTFTASTVGFAESCSSVAQIRTCQNGVLSGNAQYSTCNPDSAKSCLFDGRTIPHGESTAAFQTSTSQFGGSCVSENRVCSNGQLSGTFQFASCAIDQPASCLLNGSTIIHGGNITAYVASSVPAGQACVAETRVCQNGQLSGTATNSSCVVDPPVVVPPVTPPVVVPPITPPTPPPVTCTEQGIQWEFANECRGHCGRNVEDHKSRFSRDGGKTWTTIVKNKTPEDLQAIWNYLINKHGQNKCDRPNVNYKASANKGYVVLDLSQLSICGVCRFEDVEQNSSAGHGQCGRSNNKKTTVVKYVCSDVQKVKKVKPEKSHGSRRRSH